MDDENFADLTTLSAPSLGDISNDGTLGLDDTPNVESDSLPDFDPLASDDVAPLDNINGSSNTNGDATPALNSMFSTGNPLGAVVDALTGGASGLADDLAGDFAPVPANQTATSDYTPLIVGGAGIALLFLLLK